MFCSEICRDKLLSLSTSLLTQILHKPHLDMDCRVEFDRPRPDFSLYVSQGTPS